MEGDVPASTLQDIIEALQLPDDMDERWPVDTGTYDFEPLCVSPRGCGFTVTGGESGGLSGGSPKRPRVH